MPRSPFEIAFDHLDSCAECDFVSRRMCPAGRALFNAAHEACKLIAGGEIPQGKAQA